MKRSRAIRLVLMGTAALSVAACDEGEKVEVGVFETVEQCTLTARFTQAQCEEAIAAAKADHAKVAPRFESRVACEEEFGAEKCTPAPENANAEARADGGGFFMPVMMGYMMGRMLSGGGYSGQPLYRPASAPATGFANARGETVARAAGVTAVPASVAKASVSPIVQRGGFGSSTRRFGSVYS